MSMYILTYTSVVNAGNFKAEWAKSFDHFDESLISIDLTHDVSGVFNWSVRQLFLWVSVEYWDIECGKKLFESCEGTHCAELLEKGCHQEVVVWDKIITRDSPHTDRMKITPESRRECPNPRTPYCHYYYNLKEDRQLEMRDMETTVKVRLEIRDHNLICITFALLFGPFPLVSPCILPCFSSLF